MEKILNYICRTIFGIALFISFLFMVSETTDGCASWANFAGIAGCVLSGYILYKLGAFEGDESDEA